jgi:hypothetical protein
LNAREQEEKRGCGNRKEQSQISPLLETAYQSSLIGSAEFRDHKFATLLGVVGDIMRRWRECRWLVVAMSNKAYFITLNN